MPGSRGVPRSRPGGVPRESAAGERGKQPAGSVNPSAPHARNTARPSASISATFPKTSVSGKSLGSGKIDEATFRHPKSRPAASPRRLAGAQQDGILVERTALDDPPGQGIQGIVLEDHQRSPGFSARRHSLSKGSRISGGTWCITTQNTTTSKRPSSKGRVCPS